MGAPTPIGTKASAVGELGTSPGTGTAVVIMNERADKCLRAGEGLPTAAAGVSTLTGLGSPAFARTRSSIDGHAYTGEDVHPWAGRGRSQKRMELLH